MNDTENMDIEHILLLATFKKLMNNALRDQHAKVSERLKLLKDQVASASSDEYVQQLESINESIRTFLAAHDR